VSPIRVLIADDHTRTRALMREALDADGSFTVCAEAPDAASAIREAELHRPDVCLIDIHMPGNGIAATRQIVTSLPDTAVVILTVSHSEADLFDALRAGASSYLLKDTAYDQLPGVLHRTLAGEAVMPGSLVARLVEEFRDREHRRVAIGPRTATRLTGREWDVLELMREGLSTAGIAGRLFISPTTVRTHVSSILRKLNVTDREAAIRLLETD
jgi:DNA-binding NarL/FixJ family response regulator